MPHKRPHAESSHPSVIKRTFATDEAALRYRTSLANKKCIPERGFENPIKQFYQTIKNRDWGYFAAQPTRPVVVPVVREFYANARDHQKKKVLVRGELVKVSRSSINEYYHLPKRMEDDYTALKSQPIDYDEILNFLAKPGTKWKKSGDTVIKFPTKDMHLMGKVWHYFVIAKLMPSTNLSEVTRERALINYAIQTGLSIDIGKIIEESIYHFAAGLSHTGGFGHPSLIFDLCLLSGVQTSEIEEKQQPRPAITPRYIRKLGRVLQHQIDEEEDEEHDEEMQQENEEEEPQQHQSDPAPSTSRDKGENSAWEEEIKRMNERIEDLEYKIEYQTEVIEHQSELSQSIDEKLASYLHEQEKTRWVMMEQQKQFQRDQARRQEQQFTYMTQLSTAFASMLSTMSPHLDPSHFQLPPPPTFSSFASSSRPPSGRPEEEEGDEEIEDDEE